MIKKKQANKQKSHISVGEGTVQYVDLLEIQLKSFKNFFQIGVPLKNRAKEGLYKVLMENFPIEDLKKNYVLEFLDYSFDLPKYTPGECVERGLTYDVPLKAKLRLLQRNEETEKIEVIEQEVFFGNIPYMTPQGSFVVNGVERVVVSQIHKSPGVFFSQNKHISGLYVYTAKVIPFKGSWIEFIVDVNGIMYVYIDRKKKIPITVMLRAMGYSSDKDILDIFNLAEEVKASKEILTKYIGRKLAVRVLRSWVEDFVDEESGEVLSLTRSEVVLERHTVLSEDAIELILASEVDTVVLHRGDEDASDYNIIYNTFQKDNTNNKQEAIEQIYRQLRNVEAPDEESAKETVEEILFNTKRYDLGEVGRYRINKKFGLDIPIDTAVLTKEDIIQIINYLIRLVNGKVEVDDIDHLCNRRVRSVGEQLYAQFSIGLARLARAIRERMNIRESEDFKPADLINARTLSSVIISFFGLNPLSQLIDQINPLAEITHKRRVSALGPGGLSRDRAGFEVRDVHYSHYGRLCTIETPEGMNIGLISSLCMHARVNDMGFIETPYRKVVNGKVDLKGEVEYFTAEAEDVHHIAPASVLSAPDGTIQKDKVYVRNSGDCKVVKVDKVSYMDVASSQIASVAASLIPFLEHNDASRALMGSNMQRQAVPLVQPEVPIICTGIEKKVAQEFRGLPMAECSGTVTYVDAKKIVIQHDLSDDDKLASFGGLQITYQLTKFKGTNRDTCINHTPIVNPGDRVTQGQLLCEGYATKEKELALGRNLKVAFLSWKGYNFEDAIVVSERLVTEDLFTSIHIKEFVLEVKDTKFGAEEITNEIPNVSEATVSKLDEFGVVKVGTEVKEGDILVGKVTPKGEIDVTPEAKLLKAIFGEKAGDVKNTSLKVSSSIEGIVIDTNIFSVPSKDKESRAKVKKEIEFLKKKHARELLMLREVVIQKLFTVLQGEISMGVYHQYGDAIIAPGQQFTKDLIVERLVPLKNIYRDESQYNLPEEVNLLKDIVVDGWVSDDTKNFLIQRIVEGYCKKWNEIVVKFKRDVFVLDSGDGLPKDVIKLVKIHIASKRKLKVGDKMSGRHGNKGIVCNIVPQEDMPFLADGTPVDIVLSPLGLPSRMNLGQLYEAVLGWVGYTMNSRYENPIFEGASLDTIIQELEKANLPAFGKTDLYDGLTGDKFDQKVTVGVVYMLKLAHLVDDKMHARSVGPYSLITQQPLGGKAQFGGQRFGEMEVWALEAYGAAYTLQEMLTIKSDDVVGRSKAYESIVKGVNIPTPNISESFKVLMHELQGLCLEITLK